MCVQASSLKVPANPEGLFSSISVPDPIIVPTPRKGQPIIGPDLGALFKRFKRLQNGSDVRGIAMAGIPDEPVSLTPGAAFFIGVGFAHWLSARTGLPIASLNVSVGGDPRLSGPMIEGALVAGLASTTANVSLFGLATTPCMFFSLLPSTEGTEGKESAAAKYNGSIMITASHMPWNASGLKFFTLQGGLEKADISAILELATQASATAGVMLGEVWYEMGHILTSTQQASRGTIAEVDFRPTYATFLRELIIKGVGSKTAQQFPLLGMKIIVDAGNGAGGFLATEVLAPLGADITGSRFLDPDGSFPNHIPNPEHPSAMASGAAAVLEVGADLGIVLDTDVDRSGIVDSAGKEINSNRFIALMAAVVLREHPGTTVVTDSVTSNGLTEFITALGGQHVRFKRGYKNVINKGIELNTQGVECHLMMETSGHGAIKSNYYLDDGAYMAVQVVIEAVRRRQAGSGDISELLAALAEPLESKEYRIRIQDQEFQPIGQQVLKRFNEWLKSKACPPGWTLDPINHEGWRVSVDEKAPGGRRGWVLLRQSLHDPLLVLNIESEVKGGSQALVQQVLAFLCKECGTFPLDLQKLRV
eukprot:CAMPEP_0119109666 /NCGR_PEP_ID=MMETSP1180-20130426/21825_1 /TAXON_ID=3052 ORGANISM="Chlamydomonas cf sp, Strain CCMP681" /NCGR_SAMPLE_ID=MMETSP1180 /ASSEMBLY_ACC=CAM_ASM_000741 /LENGTH=590 /DNA_ID=CAMNT_0007095541 /DNA_START=19 /DNA_END=1791 /DNA_ORIENTATION=-